MKRGWVAGWWGLAALAVVACAELFAPPIQYVSLHIVPVFGEAASLAADDADRLRIQVFRDSGNTFRTVATPDTVVPIDPATGEATANLKVALVQTPQRFRILLTASRSSDNVTLYTGVDTVLVQGAGDTPSSVEIPVVWEGPRAARVVIAPKDTAVSSGGTFTLRATAFDAANVVLPVGLRFDLVNPADSVLLNVNRLTGVAVAAATGDGIVRVVARSQDTPPATDTARVSVGAVPAGVRITPGFLNVAQGGSGTLTGTLVDPIGNPLPGALTWIPRTPSVASVSSTGGVTALAVGSTVVVVSGLGFSDSVVVTVAPTSNVVARTVAAGRHFRSRRVADTVTVDIVMDMSLTPSEKLGSYNATLTWNPAVLTYIDVQAGDIAAPTINTANVATGELRLGAADATGKGGLVIAARVRLRAAAAGSATPTLALSELSAAGTFTNLITRVTITNGVVAVQ